MFRPSRFRVLGLALATLSAVTKSALSKKRSNVLKGLGISPAGEHQSEIDGIRHFDTPV